MDFRGKSYIGAEANRLKRKTSASRVALVIGNSAYSQAPLLNPRNDALNFSSVLCRSRPDFDVDVHVDVNADDIEAILEAFSRKVANYDDALFYFAGHGLQVDNKNYIVPIGVRIDSASQLTRRAFSLEQILDSMQQVKNSRFVFLDACRNNPFVRALSAGLTRSEQGSVILRSGLAPVNASPGSFVAFATAPNNVASDGSGLNSPFTRALLDHFGRPGESISDLMIRVRRSVLKETDGRQDPCEQSNLRLRFCFVDDGTTESYSSEAHSEKEANAEWELIGNTRDPKVLLAFRARFFDNEASKLALAKINELASERWQSMSGASGVEIEQFIEEFPGSDPVKFASQALIRIDAAEATLTHAQRQSLRQSNRLLRWVDRAAMLIGGLYLAAFSIWPDLFGVTSHASDPMAISGFVVLYGAVALGRLLQNRFPQKLKDLTRQGVVTISEDLSVMTFRYLILVTSLAFAATLVPLWTIGIWVTDSESSGKEHLIAGGFIGAWLVSQRFAWAICTAIIPLWLGQISANPLARDGAGGLGAIGRFYLLQSLLVLMPTFYMLFWNFSIDMGYSYAAGYGDLWKPQFARLMLYDLIAVFLLSIGFPLVILRIKMQHFARKLVIPATHNLDNQIAQLRKALAVSKRSVDQILEEISELEDRRALLTGYPRWPLSIGDRVVLSCSIFAIGVAIINFGAMRFVLS